MTDSSDRPIGPAPEEIEREAKALWLAEGTAAARAVCGNPTWEEISSLGESPKPQCVVREYRRLAAHVLRSRDAAVAARTEECAKAICDRCAKAGENPEVRPAEFRDGHWWHFWSDGSGNYCAAAAIRSLGKPS